MVCDIKVGELTIHGIFNSSPEMDRSVERSPLATIESHVSESNAILAYIFLKDCARWDFNNLAEWVPSDIESDIYGHSFKIPFSYLVIIN
jgi:hypothetical protein